MSRGLIISVLLWVFGPLAGLLLERYMTNAPDYVWRLVTLGCICAGVIIACLSNPVYDRLKGQTATAISSTIIAAFAAAIVFGATWYLFIFPKIGIYKSSESISADDEVKKTEALLAEVPDHAYRQLVAAVIDAIEPKAELAVGALVDTPDGRRKVDVVVRSSDWPRMTAIDIVYSPMDRKAGIEVVDIAQAKMADIKADAMLICSNTGFDANAIKKAKRVKIGLIAVLHRGDQRVKAVIEEIMYLRRWDLNPFTFTYHGETGLPQNLKLHDVKYHGESVDAWLLWRAMMIAVSNPTIIPERGVTASFKLKETTEFEVGQKRIKLDSLSVRFHPHVKWFSQTVQLDATAGIYDYIRGKVRLAKGKNTYFIHGIDFYVHNKELPLSSPPEIEDIAGGFMPGEIDISLHTFGVPKDFGDYSPTLEAIVQPEDLTTRIESTH